MPTTIWFGEGQGLDIGEEPADVAKLLGSETSSAKFLGGYCFMRTEDERDVWVNPAAVTYLERRPS